MMAEPGGSRSKRGRLAMPKQNESRPLLLQVNRNNSKTSSSKNATTQMTKVTVPTKLTDVKKSNKIEAPRSSRQPILSKPMTQQVVMMNLQQTKAPPIPPEVWEQIAVYLDLQSLKSLRLCNKMLYAVTNRTIHYRHEGYVINFKFDKDKNKCYFSKQLLGGQSSSPTWIKRRESVQDLIDLIDTSRGFPCTTIKLCGGTMDCTEIIPFFQTHGNMIKTLHIEFCRRRPKGKLFYSNLYIDGHSVFLELLLLTPNLESLQVSLSEEILENTNGIRPVKNIKLSLPSLKSFDIANFDILTIYMIETILTGAPNLKIFTHSIRGLRVDYVNVLIKTNKLETIKHLHFQPDTTVYELYDKLAHLNPKFKSLTFNLWNLALLPHLWQGVSEMMTKILESSQDSLQKIVLETPISFLNVNWPVLNKVVDVRIELNRNLFQDPSRRGLSLNFLPSNFNWSQVFPNFKNLTIDFKSDVPYPTGRLPIFGNTTSVKILDIPCAIPFSTTRCPQSLFEELPLLFPNLDTLSVMVNRGDFAKVLRIIWSNFTSLKSLKVKFVNTTGLWLRAHIDAVITGFSESTCIKLKDGESFQQLESLRVNSSILNLKDLKELEIIFETEESWTGFSVQDRLLTDVSAWHAFQLIPQLRVKILVWSRETEKVDKALRSLASHVAVQVLLPLSRIENKNKLSSVKTF